MTHKTTSLDLMARFLIDLPHTFKRKIDLLTTLWAITSQTL